MKHFLPLFIATCLVNIFVAYAAADPTVYFNNFSNRSLVFRMPAQWSGILLIDNVRVTDQSPEI